MARAIDKVYALVKAVRVIWIVDAVVRYASAITRISLAEFLALLTIGFKKAIFLSRSRRRRCTGTRTTTTAERIGTMIHAITLTCRTRLIHCTCSLTLRYIVKIVITNSFRAVRSKGRVSIASQQAGRIRGIITNRRRRAATATREHSASIVLAEFVHRKTSAEILTFLTRRIRVATCRRVNRHKIVAFSLNPPPSIMSIVVHVRILRERTISDSSRIHSIALILVHINQARIVAVVCIMTRAIVELDALRIKGIGTLNRHLNRHLNAFRRLPPPCIGSVVVDVLSIHRAIVNARLPYMVASVRRHVMETADIAVVGIITRPIHKRYATFGGAWGVTYLTKCSRCEHRCAER